MHLINLLTIKQSEMSRKKTFKLVMIGDSAVGKTSILNSFIGDKFIESHKATVGADFADKEVTVGGQKVILDIWDTAGQERYRSLGLVFYRGSNCCILVFDLTSMESFNNIEPWMTSFKNSAALSNSERVSYFMIGNKLDLEQQRQVHLMAINEFIANHPQIKYFETSAKNGEGIKQVFNSIASLLIINHPQQPIFIIPQRKPCKCCLQRNRIKKKQQSCC